jgi:hypothetical protein
MLICRLIQSAGKKNVGKCLWIMKYRFIIIQVLKSLVGNKY